MAGLPPIVKATLQAATINASSNIVAQAIDAYRKEFTAVAIINTPIAYLWMTNLEASFPAHSDSTPEDRRKIESSEKQKEKESNSNAKPPALNIKNTVLKVVLDQTIGSAMMLVLFLSTKTLLRGGTSEDISKSIRNDFWPIMIAGLKVWPLVSLLSFSVVPVNQRVLFGSMFGFVWAIYLSLITSS